MYESLKQFKRIVVSGPQRSGTRITAKIIAHDTEYDYIDEHTLMYRDFQLLQWYLTNRENIVVQCPALCHRLHDIKDDETLIVVVRRPIQEIEASEKRINWPQSFRDEELAKYNVSDGCVSQIKYDFWERTQKPILGDRGRDINYYDLENHKLFIKNRENFTWSQTE